MNIDSTYAMYILIGVGITSVLAVALIFSLRQSAHGTPAPGISPDAPVLDDREAPHPPADQLILRGLQDLVRREDDGRCVTFEHPEKHKAIRYTRTEAGLALDFPEASLTPAERRRAGAFVRELGALPIADRANAEDAAGQSVEIGEDYVRAAELGSAAFRDVYGLTGPLPLLVTTQ